MNYERFKLLIPTTLALLIVTSGCTSKAEKPPQAAAVPTVEVIEAAPSAADLYSDYPAETFARNMVEVRGRVEGYIEQWLFRPGQEVTAGQPLYILDLRPYQAQVNQAQGTLQQTEADVTFAQKQVSVLQAEANLATAQSNLLKAQQDYNRLKPLVEQDAAAQQDLDAAAAALRAAEASVKANQASLQQTRLTTETQVQSAEGRLQAQKATLETARLNVQYGTIRAPISGLIGDTQVPVGGLVTPAAAQPLTTIVPLDPIWVRFKVSDSEYLKIKQEKGGMARTGGAKNGPELELTLSDGSVFPQRGHLANALNQVDPRTGTLEVQAEFANPRHTLLPGQFGRIRYVTEHRTGVILIPQRAVQQNQSLQTVYVASPENKIEGRAVKTGARVGERWLIENGLQPGDRVVVEGLLAVRPGATVKVVPFREKPSATNAAGAGE